MLLLKIDQFSKLQITYLNAGIGRLVDPVVAVLTAVGIFAKIGSAGNDPTISYIDL